MDYSLLLITEVNPFYTESRKLTIQQRKDRISKAESASSAENPNPLAMLSKQHPSIVPEVPEDEENDDNFHLPDKIPQRDEFGSMQNARSNNAMEFPKDELNRQNTVR